MDNKNLKCPNCGAPMTVHTDRNEAVCDYCGHTIILMKEKSDKEKIKFAKDATYARETARQRAIAEAEEFRRKRKIKSIAIAVCVLAILAAAAFLFTQHSKPEIDPFDYVEVTFSGVNGEGKAAVRILNGKDDTDVSSLSYEVSPEDELSEGDYVTVNVSCENNEYRLTSSSQKYEVKGLLQYLSDLNSLDESQLQSIYVKNEELQGTNLSTLDSNVEAGAITPVMLCLLTDNNTTSKLYVISEVTCTKGNQTKTHYLVTEMQDAVAGNGNISFGYSCYNGNLSGSVSENGGGFIFSYTSEDAAAADIKTADTSLMYSELALK